MLDQTLESLKAFLAGVANISLVVTKIQFAFEDLEPPCASTHSYFSSS